MTDCFCLRLRYECQKREDKHVDGARALTLERDQVAAFFGSDEKTHDLAQVFAREVRSKKGGCISVGSEIDELAHAGLNLAPNLLELANVADRRGEIAQPFKRVVPHLVEAGSADAQDRVEQRSALQAQGARTCAQRSQEKEAAKPLVLARKRPQPSPEPDLLVVVSFTSVLRVSKERVADKVILGRVVATYKDDGQGPAGPGGISRLRSVDIFVGE